VSFINNNASNDTRSPSSDQTECQLTAATVVKVIGTWEDLSAAMRRTLVSAVNSVCRVAGVPAEMLVLIPMRLRESVLQKNAVAWDVNPANRSNILSRLNYIMNRLSIIDPTKVPLVSDWANLKSQLDKRGQMSLPAFIRFCALKDIAPLEVSDPILDEFEAWLTSRTLIAEPRPILTAARRAWNKAAKEIKEWPKTELTKKSLRGQLLLPLTEFPGSFQEELKGHVNRLSGDDADAAFGVENDNNTDGGAEQKHSF
jgi:hypothetical protein